MWHKKDASISAGSEA